MTDGTLASGRCHCGNLELTLASPRPPERLPVRACACSFCRGHGARTTSDPDGRVSITVHAPELLSRYRFGMRTAEFLICARCGAYLAAVLTVGGSLYATVNINALDCAARFTQPPLTVTYEAETAAERVARRVANWTPVVSIIDPIHASAERRQP